MLTLEKREEAGRLLAKSSAMQIVFEYLGKKQVVKMRTTARVLAEG